jgi:hypothetical protein
MLHIEKKLSFVEITDTLLPVPDESTVTSFSLIWNCGFSPLFRQKKDGEKFKT